MIIGTERSSRVQEIVCSPLSSDGEGARRGRASAGAFRNIFATLEDGREFMVDIRVNSDPGTLPSMPLAFHLLHKIPS